MEAEHQGISARATYPKLESCALFRLVYLGMDCYPK